jgi:2,4-dichlorophenol 6-monooxygenase
METFTDAEVADAVYAKAPPEDRWHRVAWCASLAGPTPLYARKMGELPAWGGGPGGPVIVTGGPCLPRLSSAS